LSSEAGFSLLYLLAIIRRMQKIFLITFMMLKGLVLLV